MKKFGQKALAVLLCVIMVFSCMTVSASALITEAMVLEAIMLILEQTNAIEKWAEAMEYNSADEVMSRVYQDVTGRTQNYDVVRPSKKAASYSQVLKVNLNSLASDWNSTYRNYQGIAWTVRTATTTINGEKCWVLAINIPKSQFVLENGYDTWFLCDGFGNVLYATEDDSIAGGNRWVSKTSIGSQYYLMSYEDLNNLALKESGTIRKHGDYYIITGPIGTNCLVNPDGYPYAAIARGDSAAVNQDRPVSSGSVTNNNTTNNYISQEFVEEGDTIYIKEGDTYHETNYDITNIEEGDTWYVKEGDNYYEIIIDNSQHIDIENMTQVLPGGVINEIDSIIYDDNTKTYYVDSHDSTTNETNFTINQYHINYTSVTYIGYTEQYDKYYELYYELPDGRDSADLTAADLEQLSTSFKDVMNYARSADDLSQRALYHFDGNTEDSSYWSYASDFHWNKGASLTYMDEGTFGGSLYLDETEHDFTLTLPGNDAAGDFTLQFRYYQSYTAAPSTDSYITVGGVKVMQLDGAKYYNGSGTAITATSIGSWNELCLMRKDGVLYYYINGIPYGSMSVSIGSSAVRFYFGTTQQTYKKLDELRFTRGAIYEPGQNYTPTSVPYDSNLSLVLPDGKIPLVDEVAALNPSGNNNFIANSLDDWSDPSVLSHLVEAPKRNSSSGNIADSNYFTKRYKANTLYVNSSAASFSPGDGFTSISFSGSDFGSWTGTVTEELANGLFLPVSAFVFVEPSDGSAGYYSSAQSLYRVNTDFTFSVVLADFSYSSVTFRVVSSESGTKYTTSIISSDISSNIKIEVDALSYWAGDDDSDVTLNMEGLKIIPAVAGMSCDILYMELYRASAPQWSFSYEGAVYDPGELTESPILAVRSNTPISTYQIGGVRPSYPQKGQVYAMVEGGYITSLQQYTGYAWESVDGRIWTGSRWIPASSYNVITLQDMYDIVDATEDFEYIYTDSGFWDWWQRSWNSFVNKLFNSDSGGAPGAAGSVSDTVLPPVEDDIETEGDEGWGAVDLLIVIKDGTWSIITGVISAGFNGLVGLAQSLSHVNGFFDAYDADSSANVLGITNYGGSDIWD